MVVVVSTLQILATSVAVVAFYERLGYRVEGRISMRKLLGFAQEGQ